MPRKRGPKPGLAETVTMAQRYVVDTLNTVQFPVGDMNEDQFSKCMGTIARELVAAWAAGYKAGVER